MQINSYICNFLIGNLEISDNSTAITSIQLTDKEVSEGTLSPLALMAYTQLTEYFEGKRKEFTLPLAPEGTEFRKKVWKALCDIPYGETRSYGDIAKAVGNPKASRAVGGANNKNPIIIVIPCHRVIGADGSLTGYACGIEIKKRLLELEKGI